MYRVLDITSSRGLGTLKTHRPNCDLDKLLVERLVVLKEDIYPGRIIISSKRLSQKALQTLTDNIAILENLTNCHDWRGWFQRQERGELCPQVCPLCWVLSSEFWGLRSWEDHPHRVGRVVTPHYFGLKVRLSVIPDDWVRLSLRLQYAMENSSGRTKPFFTAQHPTFSGRKAKWISLVMVVWCWVFSQVLSYALSRKNILLQS